MPVQSVSKYCIGPTPMRIRQSWFGPVLPVRLLKVRVETRTVVSDRPETNTSVRFRSASPFLFAVGLDFVTAFRSGLYGCARTAYGFRDGRVVRAGTSRPAHPAFAFRYATRHSESHKFDLNVCRAEVPLIVNYYVRRACNSVKTAGSAADVVIRSSDRRRAARMSI